MKKAAPDEKRSRGELKIFEYHRDSGIANELSPDAVVRALAAKVNTFSLYIRKNIYK